jgi:hypothetical protein
MIPNAFPGDGAAQVQEQHEESERRKEEALRGRPDGRGVEGEEGARALRSERAAV